MIVVVAHASERDEVDEVGAWMTGGTGRQSPLAVEVNRTVWVAMTVRVFVHGGEMVVGTGLDAANTKAARPSSFGKSMILFPV